MSALLKFCMMLWLGVWRISAKIPHEMRDADVKKKGELKI